MKTHKATAKKFELSGSGKVMRVKAWRGHHLELKSSRRTRRMAGRAEVDSGSLRKIRKMLPYLGV